jgi:hypothetical protein
MHLSLKQLIEPTRAILIAVTNHEISELLSVAVTVKHVVSPALRIKSGSKVDVVKLKTAYEGTPSQYPTGCLVKKVRGTFICQREFRFSVERESIVI